MKRILKIPTRARKPLTAHPDKEAAVNSRRKANREGNKRACVLKDQLASFKNNAHFRPHLAARKLMEELAELSLTMALLQWEANVPSVVKQQALAIERTIQSMKLDKWNALVLQEQIDKLTPPGVGVEFATLVKKVASELRDIPIKQRIRGGRARKARTLWLAAACEIVITIHEFPDLDQLRRDTLAHRKMSPSSAVLDAGVLLLKKWLASLPDWPVFSSLRERAQDEVWSSLCPQISRIDASDIVIQRVAKRKSLNKDSNPRRKRVDTGLPVKTVPRFERALREGAHTFFTLLLASGDGTEHWDDQDEAD